MGKKEALKRDLTHEEVLNYEELAKKIKKSRKRELVNPFLEEEHLKTWYGNSVKTAYLLNSNPRGLTSFGRDGGLDY